MRTTLTLDPDTARLLADEAHRTRRPFKQVVNDAIRRGLAPRGHAPPGRYRVLAHRAKLRPGIEVESLNRLVDELEDEARLTAKGRR